MSDKRVCLRCYRRSNRRNAFSFRRNRGPRRFHPWYPPRLNKTAGLTGEPRRQLPITETRWPKRSTPPLRNKPDIRPPGLSTSIDSTACAVQTALITRTRGYTSTASIGDTTSRQRLYPRACARQRVSKRLDKRSQYQIKNVTVRLTRATCDPAFHSQQLQAGLNW